MEPFTTFFMGGYECADHINRSGERINLSKETQHDIRFFDDYETLSKIGIKTVRRYLLEPCREISEKIQPKFKKSFLNQLLEFLK